MTLAIPHLMHERNSLSDPIDEFGGLNDRMELRLLRWLRHASIIVTA